MDSIRVLHVDDETAFVDLTAEFLERERDHFVVTGAASASQARAVLDAEDVDCVVSDYDMPGEHGIAFLESVREHDRDLPFILFTGKGSEEVASDAISAGVTDYLQKKVGSEQYQLLANRIRTAVGNHRTARTLERQNDLFTKAQRLASVGSWEYDHATERTFTTGEVLRIHGLGPDEALTPEQSLAQYHPDDRAEIREAFDRAVGDGEPYDLTLRLHGVDGEQRWVRTQGDPQFEDGHLRRVRGTIQDITEQKRREERLRRQKARLQDEVDRRKAAETRYRSLFENNPIVIWEHDFADAKRYVDDLASEVDDLAAHLRANPDELGHIMERVEVLDVNDNAVAYYQADSKQHVLDNLDEVMAEEAWELTVDLWTAIAAGETRFRGETTAVTFDGERRHQILELYVPDAYATDYSRVYLTGTDITERKQYERELDRQKRRLETFMDALAHDIPNHLAVADGSLELAEAGDSTEYFDRIHTAHERIETHIENLKMLLRTGAEATDTEWVALDTVAQSCWDSCFASDDPAHLIVERSGRIDANENRLKQLLENLYWNVREHVGDDVTVRIGVTDDGFYVADDGPGIRLEDRETVFGAGFTTATEGHTGFGLAIVREIAHAHDWTVRLSESADGGARFDVSNVDVTA